MSSYEEMIKHTCKENQPKYGRDEVEFKLHMQEQKDIWSNHNILEVWDKKEGAELNEAHYLLLNGMTKQHTKRLGLWKEDLL